MSPEAYGVLGAVVTAVVTWLVAVRKMGGTVKSSEASQLWDESSKIRDWATKRLEFVEAENIQLRKELQTEREARTEDSKRIAALEARITDLLNGDEPPWKA